ncbi:hypothetical protein ACFSO7_02570 [Bacillus sp. CGMCC 1.16607]|uniref:hypothetical protein n=1 Tax=Bacillus sp. CGMCC 1.16607 TaxID=3351842 RepID=UPI00363AF1B1
MEEENILQEILSVLKVHSNQVENKLTAIDARLDEMDLRMTNQSKETNERLDRIEKKMDGFRVELTESQESFDYLASKVTQHERKLRELYRQ